MARLTVPKKILFSVLVVTGAWLGAEAIVTHFYAAELRAWDSPPPAAQSGAPNMQGNAYLLWEIAPGTRYEQGVSVNINSVGLRGPEIEIPKPAQTRRLLTTGDSSVFGFGVQDNEVFSTVAADKLGPKAEAVCGAIPGYSSLQSLNLLKIRALDTAPDLLVIGNIWSDNNFDAFVDKDLLATYAGHRDSFTGLISEKLSSSAIFRVIDWRLRVLPQAREVRKVGWMQGNGTQNGLLGSGNQIGLRRVAINDYARALEAMVELAKDRGAEVLFVLLPNNEDIAGSTQPENLQNQKAWEPYREVMRAAAARHGAPIIEGAELFIETGIPANELFLDEMHPTAKGHAILGDALFSLLDEAGWVDGGQVMTKGTGSALQELTDPFVAGNRSPIPGGAPAAIGGNFVGGVVQNVTEEGWIQIDAIQPGDLNPTVLGSTKLKTAGSFQVPIGNATTVVLRAYIDRAGDGPDAEDPLFEFSSTVLQLDDAEALEAAGNLVMDFKANTIEMGGATPAP